LKKEGARLDMQTLSQLLGNIPVILTAANQGRGIPELIAKAVRAAKQD
jgi:Fe2+ transport system protein B